MRGAFRIVHFKRRGRSFPRSAAAVFLLAFLFLFSNPAFPAGSVSAASGEPQPNRLSPEEAAQGFQLLFDGTYESFHANFVDYQKNDSVSDGLGVRPIERYDSSTGRYRIDTVSWWKLDPDSHAMITDPGTYGGPDARSRRKFRDFDFRVDYRSNGSQGFYYRTLLTQERAWQTGVEYKLWDFPKQTLNRDTAGVNAGRYPRHANGAAYDLYGPTGSEAFPYETGKWNSVRIVAIGDSVEHWLNGIKVVGYRYHSRDFWTRYDVSKWNHDDRLTNKVEGNRNGGFIEAGYLGIRCDWVGLWNLRNIRINETHPAFGPVAASGISRPLARTGERGRPGRLAPSPAFSVGGKTDATLDGKRIPARL